jgi:hypothetical protein
MAAFSDRAWRTEFVDLHRVIDDQLGRQQRVDPGGVAAQAPHRLAHGGQIDHRGNAGEILQQDAAGLKGDLVGGLGLGLPAGQRADVGGAHRAPVLRAQQILQQDAQRKRQTVRIQPRFFQRGQPVNRVLLVPDLERGQRAEAVRHGTILRVPG